MNSDKKLLIYFRMIQGAEDPSQDSWDMGLCLDPLSSSIYEKNPIELEIIISGLEGHQRKHAFGNLAAFDFKINYDRTALDFAPHHIWATPSVSDSYPGGTAGRHVSLHHSDFSFVRNFCFRSPDSLGLATLSFFGKGLNIQELSFSNKAFDDGYGVFSLSMGTRKADISETPEQSGIFSPNAGQVAFEKRPTREPVSAMRDFSGFPRLAAARTA